MNTEITSIALVYDNEPAAIRRRQLMQAWREYQAKLASYMKDDECLYDVQIPECDHGQDYLDTSMPNKYRTSYIPVYDRKCGTPIRDLMLNLTYLGVSIIDKLAYPGDARWTDACWTAKLNAHVREVKELISNTICLGSRLRPGSWNGWKCMVPLTLLPGNRRKAKTRHGLTGNGISHLRLLRYVHVVYSMLLMARSLVARTQSMASGLVMYSLVPLSQGGIVHVLVTTTHWMVNLPFSTVFGSSVSLVSVTGVVSRFGRLVSVLLSTANHVNH